MQGNWQLCREYLGKTQSAVEKQIADATESERQHAGRNWTTWTIPFKTQSWADEDAKEQFDQKVRWPYQIIERNSYKRAASLCWQWSQYWLYVGVGATVRAEPVCHQKLQPNTFKWGRSNRWKRDRVLWPTISHTQWPDLATQSLPKR